MRKSKIIEENVLLFKKNENLKAEIENLKIQIVQRDTEIEKLKEQLSPKANEKVSNPIMEIEKKVVKESVKLSDDYTYGSEAIGQIVVCSANYSNVLTSGGNMKYIELVNLILGKAEIAKSDILSVVSESISLDEKKSKIDEIIRKTKEYFESVMAQR